MRTASASAALCGAVASAGGIESQNVVGYQTVKSVAGFNLYAPMFRNVDGSKTKIQDIRLGEGATSYSDNIQILSAGGAMVSQYTYLTAEDAETMGLESAGWMEDFGTLADITLDPGQGIIVATASDGVDITLPAAL